MKTMIAAALMAFSAACGAAVLFEAPTQIGGKIRLTDEKSECSASTFRAEMTTPQGEKKDGCWKPVDEETIMIYWPEAGIYFYGIKGFNKTKGWL